MAAPHAVIADHAERRYTILVLAAAFHYIPIISSREPLTLAHAEIPRLNPPYYWTNYIKLRGQSRIDLTVACGHAAKSLVHPQIVSNVPNLLAIVFQSNKDVLQASLQPTGHIIKDARSAGFSNVHDFLIYQQTGKLIYTTCFWWDCLEQDLYSGLYVSAVPCCHWGFCVVCKSTNKRVCTPLTARQHFVNQHVTHESSSWSLFLSCQDMSRSRTQQEYTSLTHSPREADVERHQQHLKGIRAAGESASELACRKEQFAWAAWMNSESELSNDVASPPEESNMPTDGAMTIAGSETAEGAAPLDLISQAT